MLCDACSRYIVDITWYRRTHVVTSPLSFRQIICAAVCSKKVYANTRTGVKHSELTAETTIIVFLARTHDETDFPTHGEVTSVQRPKTALSIFSIGSLQNPA
jgi:hypothetical protein